MQVTTLLRRVSDLVIEVRQLKGENEALRERNAELERSATLRFLAEIDAEGVASREAVR